MSETFLLAGNGSYGNKGCEAIVRGTAKIIRKYFKNPNFQCYSTFENEDFFRMQSLQETDKSVVHRQIHIPRKITSIAFRALDSFSPKIRKRYEYKEMIPTLDEARAVLSVGGDTYALDWGIPKLYTDLDDIVMEKNKPLIIWGASIGPFNKSPEYENYILDHLKKVDGLFVREPETIEYLEKKGFNENIYHVGDPAFVMDPSRPAEGLASTIEDDAIGINLSTLMARYVANGDKERWAEISAKLITRIHDTFERPIYLIPHVTRPVPTDNDHTFLKYVLSKIDINKEIYLIPPNLNAAESKWIIGKMNIFMGSRMHSNIAALSSCVPTLSLAYSIKAKGINADIFGSDNFCLQPEKITVELICNSIAELLEDETNIRKNLAREIPKVQERAFNAGKYLKNIVDGL
ncbi:polysaccharide pyruvyl transferase family protein [Methanosarcina sp. DH1]|uniref:polysaccharide pyruvyl transferase family protein n=1 Tax=Methanosarcina sp. DH1 TaxID=2605695 RepID=UPI001E3071C6|nr:polysaccharide pyruvyl transferase family protein [Methanosarcina sp. DH1]MCC4765387.1 polysaccharide pyruvyl transferase family protein [Methanosarcina sp. DH1]